MAEFTTIDLNENEKNEVEKHLNFISHVTEESIKYGYRAIIGGGYAVDGAIGKITRPHQDVDIQLYGNDVITPKLLVDSLLTGMYEEYSLNDHERSEYWHSFFITEIGAKVYYIRLATKPFSDTRIVIKSDGKYSEEEDFDTKIVVLNGVRYEAQSPTLELVHKLYKREHRGDTKISKHEQDIYNLQQITDSYVVQEEIDKLVKRSYR
jgi:hypothetical protein